MTSIRVPDTTASTEFTASEFMMNFTKAERKLFYDGIRNGNTELETVRDLLLSAQTKLAMSDTLVQAGLFILMSEGVITPARAAEIGG